MPETVGAYRLEAELGRGTCGIVWRALGPDGHPAAVKLLDAHLVADARFQEELARESRALATLELPGFARLRDLIGDGAITAVAFDLLEGQDLRRRIAGGPMAAEAASALVESLLVALSPLHRQGLAHGDVRPEHVFLVADGSARLLDAGVGRAAALAGFAPPMAFDYRPAEAFETLDGPAGVAADVYAVGLVAWEALIGRPACPNGPASLKKAWHENTGAPDVRGLRRDIPEWLSEVVGTLAHRDPARRPPNGAAALTLYEEARLDAEDAAPTTALRSGMRPGSLTTFPPADVGRVTLNNPSRVGALPTLSPSDLSTPTPAPPPREPAEPVDGSTWDDGTSERATEPTEPAAKALTKRPFAVGSLMVGLAVLVVGMAVWMAWPGQDRAAMSDASMREWAAMSAERTHPTPDTPDHVRAFVDRYSATQPDLPAVADAKHWLADHPR